MGPSRRSSNGRSPLVNQQRQITSFFTKSPSPSPTLAKTTQNPNPNLASDHNPKPNPSSTPLTPSPLNPKPNKSLLVIGASISPPSASSSLYGQEVVGRRIKVYWPLDKAWYEGSIKSFDKITSKHVVRYCDDEEESLNLSKEKIEWLQESSTKKLKRLRRGFSDIRKMEIDEDDVKEESHKGEEEEHDDVNDDDVNDDDDSNDEDWGKNAASLEDAGDGEEDTDLEDEEDLAGSSKCKRVDAKKRKLSATEKLEPAKKSKSGVEVWKGTFKLSVLEPTTNLESE